MSYSTNILPLHRFRNSLVLPAPLIPGPLHESAILLLKLLDIRIWHLLGWSQDTSWPPTPPYDQGLWKRLVLLNKALWNTLIYEGSGLGGSGWLAMTVGTWLQWESLLNWETHHSPQSRSGDGTKTPDEMVIPRIQLLCKTPPTLSKRSGSGRLKFNNFNKKSPWRKWYRCIV